MKRKKPRLFGNKRFNGDPKTIQRFIMLNTRRRMYTVRRITENFDAQHLSGRITAIVSMIEQYVGLTEEMMMTYWTLRKITEDTTISPLDAYLSIDIREPLKNAEKVEYSSRKIVNDLRRATRKSFAQTLGLPIPERIQILETHLETAKLFVSDKITKKALYENWIDSTIKLLKDIALGRAKSKTPGASIVNVYNRIKHGSLFYYDKPKNQVVFPIYKNPNRSTYKYAVANVDVDTINALGNQMGVFTAANQQLFFLHLLNKDHLEAISSMIIARDWDFSKL